MVKQRFIMSQKNSNVLKPKCRICLKTIQRNAKSVCCSICKQKVHARCNFITQKEYENLTSSENNKMFYCSKCLNEGLPFGLQNDQIFNQTNSLGLNVDCSLDSLNINLSKSERKTIEMISKMISENADATNTQYCKYYSTDSFCENKIKSNDFSQYFILTFTL